MGSALKLDVLVRLDASTHRVGDAKHHAPGRRPRLRRHRLAAPDLTTYDVIEVSTSAGKDSLAMLAHIAELARAAGVLDRVVAVHADLGRVEWEGTREIAEAQAKHLGVRFIAVARPQGDLLDLVRHYGFWPKPDSRYCTAMLKRGQILRVLTELANEARTTLPEGVRRPIRVLTSAVSAALDPRRNALSRAVPGATRATASARRSTARSTS